MKIGRALLLLALVVLLPGSALAGWRWWPFSYGSRYDEDWRLRRAIEDAAEQQRLLRKQQQVQSTVRRHPAPPPSSPVEGLRNRYILLQTRLAKLQGDRAQAVRQGKSAEEIAALDTQIEQLRLQASTLKSALGPDER